MAASSVGGGGTSAPALLPHAPSIPAAPSRQLCARAVTAPLWVWLVLFVAITCMSAGMAAARACCPGPCILSSTRIPHHLRCAGGVLFALMKGVPPFNKAAWRLWWTSFLQLVPFALQTWHRTQGGGGISSHAEAQQSATTTVAATHRVPPQRMPPARPKKPSRRAFWRRWWASLPGLCAIGCVLALHFGAWSWSVNHTTLARSLLFVTTHPMLGVLGSLSAAGILLIARHTCGTGLWPSAWHPRWPTGLELLGTTVALAGAAAMVLPDADEEAGANSSAPSLAGDAAAVLGAAAMAVYLWAGAAARKWQPLWLYAFPVTLSAAVTASLASWAAEPGISLAGSGGLGLFGWAAGGRLTTLAFLSGFVSGILGHSLAILALAHLPPLIVSVSLLLEPLLGSLIGWALGEQGVPSAWTALGGSLLLMGVAAITVGQPPVADSGGGPDTPVCARSDAGRPKAGRPAVRAV